MGLSSDLMVCRPESLGLVCAAVYISTMVLFIPFAFSTSMRSFPKKIREGISITELPLYQVSFMIPPFCTLSTSHSVYLLNVHPSFPSTSHPCCPFL